MRVLLLLYVNNLIFLGFVALTRMLAVCQNRTDSWKLALSCEAL